MAASSLTATTATAQQKQRRTALPLRRRGCLHCLSCHRMTICRDSHAETMDMWPGGLRSPTVYFALRVGQLAYNIQQAAAQGPAAWRAEGPVAGAAPCALRQRRCLPPLTIQLPTTCCGVRQGDSCVYVREVQPAWHNAKVRTIRSPPPPPCQSRPSAAAALATSTPYPSPAACIPQRTVTPQYLLEQPAKRTRLSLDRAQLQQTPASGHLIAWAAARPDYHYQAAPVMPLPAPPHVAHVASGHISSSEDLVPYATTAAAAAAVAAAATAAAKAASLDSPLAAWFRRVKVLLGSPQQLQPQAQHCLPIELPAF
ncbi:hypothetical protein ACK3TF_005823 [Chlorella vulgaris]